MVYCVVFSQHWDNTLDVDLNNIFVCIPNAFQKFLERSSRDCHGWGEALSYISGRGVPPTVSKWNRWLGQFL